MLSHFANNKRESGAAVFLAIVLTFYLWIHPGGFTTDVMTTWWNQCLILGLVAAAQFFAVVVRGLDLSVGAVMALCNCVASYLVIGSAAEITLGILATLSVGVFCGLLNGIIIVYGRIQPIIVTLATATIFVGVALLLRPTPGGDIDFDLADAMTLDVLGMPVAGIITAVIIFAFWIPLRLTGLGLALYSVGSSERSAYQSGIAVDAIKITAFAASGLFAALAGLFLGFVTTTGDAGIAGNYTLNSIAAVVIGGVALSGGRGNLIGVLVGAFALKTISSVMFFTDLPPLAQPLIEGMILAIAIACGSFELLKMKNRLDIFRA